MHDFFVDRLILGRRTERLLAAIRKKAGRGGGGIHGIRQADIRGGNAVNLALAVATLGAKTLLITHSDEDHLSMLRSPFEGLPAEVRAKALRAGLTVAIEGEVNVMLGEPGGAGEFGPELLNDRDWSGLMNSGIICSVNWSVNERGTMLLSELRRRLGAGKLLFVDPADFRDRVSEYTALLKLAKGRKLFDWIALNEYEARETSRLLEIKARELGRACEGISEELGTRVDIHTDRMAFTCDSSEVVKVKVKPTRARRLTGAGDVWDAASIFAHLRGMSDAKRLEFANAAARLYVERENPIPPTEREVMSAIE
jgi:ribokinase